MHPRSLLSGVAAAALAALTAACADELPTLGDGEFPDSAVPVTLEATFPAADFVELLGTFSGFSSAAAAPYLVVANQYDGVLDAHGLASFLGFPREVVYQRDGQPRSDSTFTYSDSRLVVRVDTLASTDEPFTLQVWEATQRWDPGSATWTLAVDTGAVETPWAEPGGTRGALLGQATFSGTGDSLAVVIPGEAVQALSDTLSAGVVLTVAETGRRVALADVLLRAAVRPDSASPDTTLFFPVRSDLERTFVYTPEQPEPGPGQWAVGGILGARTLLRLEPDQQVPGCAPPQVCDPVPLSRVDLNQVAVLLTPAPVPNGFGPLAPVPLTLRAVTEPELGRSAPLGASILDQTARLERGDTVVALGVTGLAASLAANDSLPRTFMLVSELSGTSVPPTFGVAFFQGEPRLRIVYTLPARRELP